MLVWTVWLMFTCVVVAMVTKQATVFILEVVRPMCDSVTVYRLNHSHHGKAQTGITLLSPGGGGGDQSVSPPVTINFRLHFRQPIRDV